MAKILIVEDDEGIAFLERDYLEISGYEVEIKADGRNVPELVLNGGFNLLILDLMLPGGNGYDICREIRDKIDIPILMVTAKTESIDKIRGLGLGADDYIAKPFDPAELVARVQSHLKRFERLTNSNRERDDDEGIIEERMITIGNIRILTKSWKVYKAL